MPKTKMSPFGRESDVAEIPGHGVIEFGVLDNSSPARLPWYRNSASIPAEMVAEAKALAESVSEDAAEVEWRMNAWTQVITGWSSVVRMHQPWFMLSPAQALEWMSGLCLHNWERGEDVVRYNNYYLNTYDAGHNKHCTKCGVEEYVQTAFKNYSGD